jgi:putative transposase
MPQAPQSTRTFFVTSTTVGRRALLQSDRMAQLLVDVLAENRRKKRFLLHEFVIMPNHFHLLLTPAAEVPLEKALQLIKGGFSYRAKREIHFAFEIWQASFVNHRIRDAEVMRALAPEVRLSNRGRQTLQEKRLRSMCLEKRRGPRNHVPLIARR